MTVEVCSEQWQQEKKAQGKMMEGRAKVKPRACLTEVELSEVGDPGRAKDSARH